jgi:hypothetical protein
MSIFLHKIFYSNGPIPDSCYASTKHNQIDDLLYELRKWAIYDPLCVEPSSPELATVPSPLIVYDDKPSKNNTETKDTSPIPQQTFALKKTRSFLPRHMSMFQSIFVAVFGIEEYMMVGNRMLNRELEEKQKIMLELSKTPKRLKECNQRLTNDNVQEILSGLYVSTTDEIMLLVAYSIYYNRIIYLVFAHSYLVISPTKDTTVVDMSTVILLNQTRNHPKYGGSYTVDLEPTAEKLTNIHTTKIHLEHYAKPFKGISAYKMSDLEEIYKKICDLDTASASTKTSADKETPNKKRTKKELYDIIVEICCAGIARSR